MALAGTSKSSAENSVQILSCWLTFVHRQVQIQPMRSLAVYIGFSRRKIYIFMEFAAKNLPCSFGGKQENGRVYRLAE
jgi:hypothetical protein